MNSEDVNEVAITFREVKSTYIHSTTHLLYSWLSDDPSLQALVERIISSILQLRQLINFQIHTMASADECKVLRISEVISSSEVEDSDVFFDHIAFQYDELYIECC